MFINLFYINEKPNINAWQYMFLTARSEAAIE